MYFFKVLGARYIFQSQMSFSGSQIPLKRPALLYQWKYLMLSGLERWFSSKMAALTEDLGSFPSLIMAAHSGL